jgi:CDP-alcohol phosphatidyltransferase-like enzyme
MPEQNDEPHSRVEATYKAREVEGILDLYFYRPVGFRLAESFQKVKLTPATVTWLAGLFGIVAGHLYFYRDLRVNIVGMAFHVCANALDNADGQLARLTHRETREGRIIDSIADHAVFFSVYLHLALRYFVGGASPAIFLLALVAGLSHALQGAAADYYRSTYLYFRTMLPVLKLDSSSILGSDYRELSWHREPWRKLLLGLYFNFTRQQEMLAPHLKKLRDLIVRLFQGEIPDWLRTRYCNLASPELKWWGLLMTNTRMLALFAFLLLGAPIYYFWFELIPLNLLFVYLLTRQEYMAESLLEVTERWGNPA